MKNYLLRLFLLLCLTSCSFSGPNFRRLINDLLKDYEPYERPVINESDAVDVSYGLTYRSLIDLDVNSGVLTSNVWQHIQWKDSHLQWSPSDYGNITNIRLPSKRVWIPDLIPYNAADYQHVDPYKHFTRVVIKSDGMCTWVPPMILKTTCEVDDTQFVHNCAIKMGSWIYDGFKMNVTLQSPKADLSSYVKNKKWELKGIPAVRNETYYPCCSEPYVDITYNVKLNKRGYTFKGFLHSIKGN